MSESKNMLEEEPVVLEDDELEDVAGGVRKIIDKTSKSPASSNTKVTFGTQSGSVKSTAQVTFGNNTKNKSGILGKL